MKYWVVVKGGDSRFGADVPDLPGCIAVARSRAEVMELTHDAIELHLEDLKDQGLAVPVPHSSPELIDVAA